MDYVKTEEMTLSGKAIIERGACRVDAEKFIKQYGYFDSVEWSKEVENWIKENITGGISWLISNNFIKEDELDMSKLMFFKVDSTVYKLCRISNNEYQWCGITDITYYYGNNKFKTSKEAVEHMKSDSEHKIKNFNSTKEALTYYTEEPETPDRLKLIKQVFDEIEDKDYIENFCDVFAEANVCGDVSCDDCPLQY